MVTEVAPNPVGLTRAAPAARSRRSALLRLALRRLAILPVAVFLVLTAAFFMVNGLPSNAARNALGPLADDAAVAEFNHKFGLDQDLWTRYVHYLGDLVRGDLGTSYYTSSDISGQLVRYFPATLELSLLSLVVAVVLGTALGVLSAYKSQSVSGRAARMVTSVVQAVPDFAIGLLLIYVFFFLLHLAPAPLGQVGAEDMESLRITNAAALDALLRGRWDVFGSAVSQLVLPVATLGLFYSAIFSRMVGSLLRTALKSPQVEFARACGQPERRVIWYALLDVRAPIVTYIAMLAGFLIGGEAVIETVFAWNGLGQWALAGVLATDLPVIQGFILVATTFTLLLYMMLDVISHVLDPRIETAPK